MILYFCRQGHLKLVIAVYILGYLFLTTDYKSGLTSFQMVPILAEPMNTAQDVVDSNLPVRSLADLVDTFLRISDIPEYNEISKRHGLPSLASSLICTK